MSSAFAWASFKWNHTIYSIFLSGVFGAAVVDTWQFGKHSRMCLRRSLRRWTDENKLCSTVPGRQRGLLTMPVKSKAERMMDELQGRLDARSSVLPGPAGRWHVKHPPESRWVAQLLRDAGRNPGPLQHICLLCHPSHGGLCPGWHLPAYTSEQEGGRERDGTYAVYLVRPATCAFSVQRIYLTLPLCLPFYRLHPRFTRKMDFFIKRDHCLTMFKKWDSLTWCPVLGEVET